VILLLIPVFVLILEIIQTFSEAHFHRLEDVTPLEAVNIVYFFEKACSIQSVLFDKKEDDHSFPIDD